MKHCSAPWDSIQINWKGQISPCLCSIQHYRGYYGNLLEQPLEEILNSIWMSDFRKSILDQSFKWCNPRTCSNLSNLKSVETVPILSRLPKEIMLQLDKNCNLKCASCRNENIYAKEINQSVLNILENLSQSYKNSTDIVELYADGAGDVFASQAYLEYFTNSMIPENFRFKISTNGNLVTKNLDLIQKIKHKIQAVTISLDASNYETYKKIRGGNFNIVIDGIRELVNMGIIVNTEFVLQYLNYKEIVDYISLVQELGVSHIGVNEIYRWPHMSQEWWNQNKIENNSNIDYNFLSESLKVLEDVNRESSNHLRTLLKLG